MVTMAKARKSPAYQAIIDTCVKTLFKKSFFSKKEIMKSTELDCFGIATVNWDVVRRMLEEDPRLGGPVSADGEPRMQLIPLVEDYFRRKVPYKDDKDVDEQMVNPRELALRLPSKFIATGAGKRTAGYALVSEPNSPLWQAYITIKEHKALGTMNAHDKSLKIGLSQHVYGAASRRFLNPANAVIHAEGSVEVPQLTQLTGPVEPAKPVVGSGIDFGVWRNE